MKLLAYSYKRPAALLFYSGLAVGSVLYLSSDGELSNLVNLEWKVPALIYDEFLGEKSGLLWIQNNMVDELLTLLILGSGTALVFSKEKIEDEYTMTLRGAAFQWSFLANMVFVLIATFSIYGLAYFHFMIFQLFSILLLFNLRFQYLLLKHYNSAGHDE